MDLSGTTESNIGYKNHVNVAGDSAPGRLLIENPTPTAVTVSLSETDDALSKQRWCHHRGGGLLSCQACYDDCGV